jgi:hypothetical protein
VNEHDADVTISDEIERIGKAHVAGLSHRCAH